MRCNNCGAGKLAGANYCGNCGLGFESPEDENAVRGQLDPRGEGQAGGISSAPRSLIELLTESARVYRKRLPVFLGIGLIPQIPGLVGLGPLPLWWEITLIIASLGLTALTFGAITHAVARDYLGLTPTVGSSYSGAWRNGINLVVCLFVHVALLAASFVLSLLLVGIPMLFLLLVLLWFYPQAVIIEHLGPVEAFRRSILLVRGNWWRIFGIGIAYSALPVAVAVVVVTLSPDPANSKLVGLISAVIGTVTTPWIMIGSTLAYFDLRVRKEGYSVESLGTELERTGPA
jgi:hypothetical protein